MCVASCAASKTQGEERGELASGRNAESQANQVGDRHVHRVRLRGDLRSVPHATRGPSFLGTFPFELSIESARPDVGSPFEPRHETLLRGLRESSTKSIEIRSDKSASTRSRLASLGSRVAGSPRGCNRGDCLRAVFPRPTWRCSGWVATGKGSMVLHASSQEVPRWIGRRDAGSPR